MEIVARSVFVVVFACVLTVSASAQGPHIVNALCCGFQDPANGNSSETIIPAGTTVKWMRIDAQQHTVTNGLTPTSPGAGTLFNGTLNALNTMFQFTFNNLGTFPYFCSPHFGFGMTGTVFVVPPASAISTGTGCSTSTGVATLATAGLPSIGNAGFGLTVSGGPTGAPAFLFLAAAVGPPVPVSPTCSVFLDLVSLNAFMNAGITPTGPQALGAGGTTTFSFPIPNAGSLGGISVAFQALIVDALAPGGFAISNAITLVVGI